MDASSKFALMSAIVAVVSAIIAGLGAFYAKGVWRTAKTTLLHQALQDVNKNYRSPQMGYAVRTLWQFYGEHGKENFVHKYMEILDKEERHILSLEWGKRVEAEQSTLHHQKRLVSQFYQHLAGLYVTGILPRHIVYSNWSEADLKIIPDIIVPIDNKIREALRTPPLGPHDESSSLLVLYRGSKDC